MRFSAQTQCGASREFGPNVESMMVAQLTPLKAYAKKGMLA